MRIQFNYPIIILLLADFISNLGMGVTQLYTLIFIFDKTHSNFYASLQACIIFGAGLCGAFLYQKYRKYRPILPLLFVKLISCIATVVMAYQLNLLFIFIMLGVVYTLYGFYKPSFQVILYKVCGISTIQKFNAFSTIVYTLALALSWIVSPFLFSYIGYSGLFLFNAVSYLLAGLILSLLLLFDISDSNASTSIQNEYNEKNSSSLILKNYYVYSNCWFYLLVTSIAIIFATINGLEMGVFKNVYSLSHREIGMFFVGWIIAGFVSGLVHLKQAPSAIIERVYLMARILLLSTLFFFLFNNIFLGVFAYIVAGFSYAYVDTLINYWIYHQISIQFHPMYFNIKNIINNAVMLLLLPIIGYSADRISIMVTATAMLLISLLNIYFSKLGSKLSIPNYFNRQGRTDGTFY